MSDAGPDDLIERLRAGVRQRQAELAVLEASGATERLAELHRHQTLLEVTPSSHRRLLGPLIVLVRKVAKKALLHWYVQPILKQQNLYNRAATLAIQDLAAERAELARQIGELRAELASLQPRSPNR